MKTQLIGLLVALSAFAAAPAFASGYGPSPGYRSEAGAPASQRGQSAQTVAVERSVAAGAKSVYGGVAAGSAETGSRSVAMPGDNLFTHH